MISGLLDECRILVVEDDYLLADELQAYLVRAGAVVIGPYGSVEHALQGIGDGQHLDGALLDINLRNMMVFELADILIERKTPLLFATGYDRSVIPERFSAIASFEKPVDIDRLIAALARLTSCGRPARPSLLAKNVLSS